MTPTGEASCPLKNNHPVQQKTDHPRWHESMSRMLPDEEPVQTPWVNRRVGIESPQSGAAAGSRQNRSSWVHRLSSTGWGGLIDRNSFPTARFDWVRKMIQVHQLAELPTMVFAALMFVVGHCHRKRL
jgi:hypothetical protein